MSRAHAIARNGSDSSKLSPQTIKPLIACGLIIALAGLLFDFNGIKSLLTNPGTFMGSATSGKAAQKLANACTTEISTSSKLSREQLLALLAVPERDSKTRIREIVQEPYCQLSSLDIRAGVEAQREAYPLAFDPNTTLVILYENDEYAGYRFKL
ncbi:MAG: hypothetical protein AAFP20_04295 [Cyanobacteria bacterium J06614_10]